MPMTVYCFDESPPSRAVCLCIEALGLKPTRKVIDLFAKEQMSPEFTKINPQHSIPTFDDDGVVLWDSHVINSYLASKYGEDDLLYPKDLVKRAIVDQRLHFDTGVLFPRMQDIARPIFFANCKEIPEEKRQKVFEAYDLIEKFLEGHDYIAGDNFTIADFCCVATASTLVEGLGCSPDKHPRVKAWLQRCKDTLPGYKDVQDKGLAAFKSAVDAKLAA